MNALNMIKVSKALANIEGGIVKKWVSEDEYEDIVIVDKDGNTYEIKYKEAKK